MANLTGLANIVSELKAERTNLVTQLKHVDAALTVLGKLPGGQSYARPQRTVSALSRRRMAAAQRARWAKRASSSEAGSTGKPKRTVSASVRRRIAAAQRARWARVKSGAQLTPANARPKRRISAAGIARIRAAAKARWAKVRAARKT